MISMISIIQISALLILGVIIYFLFKFSKFYDWLANSEIIVQLGEEPFNVWIPKTKNYDLYPIGTKVRVGSTTGVWLKRSSGWDFIEYSKSNPYPLDFEDMKPLVKIPRVK